MRGRAYNRVNDTIPSASLKLFKFGTDMRVHVDLQVPIFYCTDTPTTLCARSTMHIRVVEVDRSSVESMACRSKGLHVKMKKQEYETNRRHQEGGMDSRVCGKYLSLNNHLTTAVVGIHHLSFAPNCPHSPQSITAVCSRMFLKSQTRAWSVSM